MAATRRSIFYLIRRGVLNRCSTDVVLDMLRYDAARPVSNPPDGWYLFEAWIGAPHTLRWRSFGVEADDILGPFPDDASAFEATRPESR